MGTKTISIMDDVYGTLSRNKRDSESFSDVIRRNMKKNNNIMDFVGIWGDLSDKEVSLVKDAISKARKSKRHYLR